jgi:hypothetical protein
MSKLWCACLISDTASPFITKRGMSCSMSVVLPLFDQPAKPNTFMVWDWRAVGAGAHRSP